MEIKKIKYQSEIFNIGSGATANTRDFDVDIDKEYNLIEGVAAYEITDGGISYYNIGFKDNDKSYHNLTHKDDWAPVAGGERYKPLSVENKGQTFKVSIQNTATLTSDIDVQIVFKLAKVTE